MAEKGKSELSALVKKWNQHGTTKLMLTPEKIAGLINISPQIIFMEELITAKILNADNILTTHDYLLTTHNKNIITTLPSVSTENLGAVTSTENLLTIAEKGKTVLSQLITKWSTLSTEKIKSIFTPENR